MKQILLVAFLTIGFFTISFGHVKNERQITRRIESYLSKIEKVGFSGSVLVELNGKQVISKGYGYRNIAARAKNTPDTIFDIGSITKQFTATAILKLETQGKLSVDDKISKYFDSVPRDKESVTIHDLLRHQSGLQGGVGSDYDKISREEFISKVMNSPLRSEVGKRFSYSNIGYSLLAMIIEKVSGKTYENYLYENLFHPANMEFTAYSRPQFNKDMIAIGYSRDDKIWGKPTDKEWDKTAPYWHLLGNGGILSTTEDLFKWHRALMTEQILSDEAKKKLYHPKLRDGENVDAIYAYGWDVSKTKRNTTLVWHNGTNNIFYADIRRFINENISVIMLSNKSHPNFNDLSRVISKIIFDKTYSPDIPGADTILARNFTTKIIQTVEGSGLEKAIEQYKKKRNNEDLLEFEMRNKGFRLMGEGKGELAVKVFEMNVFAFPKSAKAIQGLGEAYMETGKKNLALKYFKQSLAIDPDNPFVNGMIKQLEK